MRGDRPLFGQTDEYDLEFTPHARGSTDVVGFAPGQDYVYPACAGIDRAKDSNSIHMLCLPRMRGDRPSSSRHLLTSFSFTPHARGSTR